MKKLLFLLVACLFVSGCGEKVVCTYSGDLLGQKIDAEISAPVENGKISKATTKTSIEFKDEKTAKEGCKEAKTDKDSKVTCNGKKVTVEATGENSGEAVTKKEFIKSMESAGYKCK